jgi:TRAP-type mannitol/chloroaromatic compound transport system permease large subunit
VTSEPNAALIDAAVLVFGLLAIRHLLLARLGRRRWAHWIARWLRRGAIVGIIVPSLRLMTLAVHADEGVAVLWGAALAILVLGGLVIFFDAMLALHWMPSPRLQAD